MLKLSKVAVTGGLSCGKSSVCRFFKELGAYVIDADEVVHQLLSSDANLGQQVIKLLGSDIVINYQIDRSKIAQKVFNNPKLLKSLENLLHPAVEAEIKKEYQRVKEQNFAPLFVVEVPLLFEADWDQGFDVCIAVMADRDTCLKRFKESKKGDKNEYDKRMQRQLSPFEKAQRAHYAIQNNGSLSDLKDEVKRLFNQLVKQS